MQQDCKQAHIFNDVKIFYEKWGCGPQYLLCFHGYSRSSSDFQYLEASLGDRFTIFSFDFFYHGQNRQAYPQENMSHSDLSSLIKHFLTEKNIEQVSIIAFSMGGRLTLSLIQSGDIRIKKVLLLAPDGVEDAFWFDFATRNPIGHQLFKHLITHPIRYKRLANTLHKLGVISKTKMKVVNHNVGSEEQSNQLYSTWMLLKELKIDLNVVDQNIDKTGITVNVIAGKRDAMITLKTLNRWSRLKENTERLHVVEYGHILPNQIVMDLIEERNLL